MILYQKLQNDEDITKVDTHALRQVKSRHQLGLRVQFGLRRPPWTESGTSPSYDIKTRRSMMCWKANDKSFLLVLVQAQEASLTILCDPDKMRCHQFGP